MFFQQLMTEERSFVAATREPLCAFPEHRHYEIEILYLVAGEAELTVDGDRCSIRAGEAVFVGAMHSHAVTRSTDCRVLLLEFGPVFLADAYPFIADAFSDTHYLLGQGRQNKEIRRVLDAILAAVEQKQNAAEVSWAAQLRLTGLLYELCSLIVSEAAPANAAPANRSVLSAGDIAPALDIVHSRYREKISLDEVAAAAGYGKSNFCKRFKAVTGVGFHTYLNGYRVKNAGYFLRNTELSLCEIAEMTGFSDQKTFCRVFAQFTGQTPGAYRKNC